MSASFSLFRERNSPLHRLHPLTTLTLSFFCLVLGLVAPGLWGAYAVFLLLLLPLILVGRILRPHLSASLKAVLPFAISLFLVQGLFWPGGTPILDLGPLSLKHEGVLFATRTTGRILVIVSSFLILTFTARPDALMQALREKGVPRSITYIVLTTIQIVPRFQAKANTILDAQRSRGLETEGSIWRRFRALLPLVQPLVLGAIIDIEERAIALEVRAFGREGPRTNLQRLEDNQWQVWMRWLLLLGALAAPVIRFWLF
ncbi:MAG TPA: energy-coupling factor transporter transmembrane component T [Candidatus Sulfomarinibacteraceae bacterium]|nr:energy-coupling factor transporter transmembrane component T [Candidatus Sulfomarinibacteraceae bacterium]